MTAGVLLLNATYEPLRVISTRRAVSLLMRGVAEGVEGVAARLRTPSTVFEVPSVLRLRYYVNVPQRGATWSRRGVLARDDYTCVYCGVRVGERRHGRILTRADFSVDHLIPRSRGGSSTWGNTACACRWCNGRKGNRTPHEAGMRLRWEPKTPRVNYLVVSGEVPAEWKVYLRM
ncbi:MAG: HNH endonuclease [Chloroflexi bacterium]|nr:MAG: HNH endonuclease [Chloroflexota bacterium]HEY68009.1 HNH endonuclease [Thermoflexia bacterium]